MMWWCVFRVRCVVHPEPVEGWATTRQSRELNFVLKNNNHVLNLRIFSLDHSRFSFYMPLPVLFESPNFRIVPMI